MFCLYNYKLANHTFFLGEFYIFMILRGATEIANLPFQRKIPMCINVNR